MRGALATASCLLLLFGFGFGFGAGFGMRAEAQQSGALPLSSEFPVARPEFQSPIMTIKQQDLFEGSAFGKESLARIEALTKAIAAENRRIEADLAAEEKRLTEMRPTLKPEEFRPLADAFDKKVEGIRNAQEAKSRDLIRQRDADQQAFFKTAVPVLARMMQEFGAAVLLDQSTVVLSLDRIDLTKDAIARIDAETADETAVAPAAGPAVGPTPGTP